MSVLDPFDGRSEITAEEFRAYLAAGQPILLLPAEPTIPDWQTRESAFLAKVDAYAKEHGWLTYHTWKSANSAPGFPDLVMLRAGQLIVAELKVGTNRTTKAQDQWLDAFREMPTYAVDVFVWYPEAWEMIEEVLA